MRVPNLKGVPQANNKIQDGSVATTIESVPTPLLPFVAAETTAAFDEMPYKTTLRFGALGRRPHRNTAAPTLASRAIEQFLPETTEAPLPDIDAPERRQVQASNTCPSGLEYIQCVDGSFQGCGNKNICAINATTSSGAVRSTSGGATRTTAAPTGTSGRMTTATRGSSASQSSTTTDTAPTSSATPGSSPKSSAGGIAGGVIGGITALAIILFLLAFFVRRHRKTIEKRREALLPKSYQDDTGSRHQRSMSTANDIFTFGGNSKAGGGNASEAEMQALNAKKIADQRFYSSASDSTPVFPPFAATPTQQFPSPGLRAEGGPGLPPAAFLRPVQMLDGREIRMMGAGRPRSVASGSRFREEGLAVEMEDTSAATNRRPLSSQSVASPTLGESPILGHQSQSATASSTSLAEDVRRRQHHLMSWSTYDSGAANAGGQDFEMTATMTPRPPPSARSSPSLASPSLSAAKVNPLPPPSARSLSSKGSPPLSAAQVSPLPPSQEPSPRLSGGETLGSGVYVVSPMRTQKFAKGNDRR